jgi:hypothetical protein
VTADLHKLSMGRQDYYVREIAKDREEYLSGQGESPGEWLGGSAAALGVGGNARRRSSSGCLLGGTRRPASSLDAPPARM